jgi:Leucine-rich repeat (LRR) protein
MMTLAQSAQNNNVLTHIVLSGNNMEDKGRKFRGNSLRVVGLQALVPSLDKVFPKLISILLDGNGIHQASPIIEILRRAKNLYELNIADNQIG